MLSRLTYWLGYRRQGRRRPSDFRQLCRRPLFLHSTNSSAPKSFDRFSTPETRPKLTPETRPKLTPETRPRLTPETRPRLTPESRPKLTPDSRPDERRETESTAAVAAAASSPKTAPLELVVAAVAVDNEGKMVNAVADVGDDVAARVEETHPTGSALFPRRRSTLQFARRRETR